MALPQYPHMDVEDYLLLDDNSKNVRYEYLDGELRMLAGGITYHSMIKTNMTGIVYGLLRKKRVALLTRIYGCSCLQPVMCILTW